MFTGLVESVGEVIALTPVEGGTRLALGIPFAPELKLGDSVAVNGCCLTVAALGPATAEFDLLSQTMKVTSLGDLKPGSLVNLERALAVGDRLGGHFIQGHVDDTGIIESYDPSGQDHILKVKLPESVAKYCIDKGSISIDGISLTIADLDRNTATFWITPHTDQHTHLQKKNAGERVNLEADLLAKYTEKLLGQQDS